MRIEIIDRPYWIKRVQETIAIYEAAQAEENRDLEARWEVYKKKVWIPGLTGPRADAKLTHGIAWEKWYEIYPSVSGNNHLASLKILLVALTSDKTKTIYINEREMSILE